VEEHVDFDRSDLVQDNRNISLFDDYRASPDLKLLRDAFDGAIEGPGIHPLTDFEPDELTLAHVGITLTK